MAATSYWSLALLLLCCIGQFSGSPLLTVSDQDLDLNTNSNGSFILHLSGSPDPLEQEAVGISFAFQDGNDKLLKPLPSITMQPNSSLKVLVQSTDVAGHVDIVTNSSADINTDKAFVRVVVMKSDTLELTSTIVGWMYFLAWSVSFYPQIWENFKRKSVIGLNFDFLSLNIVGFTLYGIYNICLFWNDSIQDEYFSRHPRGIIPVQANDVFFPIHAVFACALNIIQCFIYDRGGQKVSKICLGILTAIAIFVVITLILGLVQTIVWLDVLYYFSYVKLFITVIKYVPQAFMNYRRKSTVGWSIGNILLDFTGGSLSIVQMMLIAYNNDDWSSIFGDPTKFGLGFFSVLFDIFFMLQHYVFYRGNLPHETLAGSNEQLADDVAVIRDPEV